MMNIYKFHIEPESLNGFNQADMNVVDCFWNKYKNNPAELKKRERAISKSAKYAYEYAYDVLKGEFQLGEYSISTDDLYSYLYASNILKGPFPLGEPAIATDSYSSYIYAIDVLKGPFPLGEPIIRLNSNYYRLYNDFIGNQT